VRYYAFEADDIRKRHSTLAVPHILSFAEIKMRLATTVLIVSAALMAPRLRKLRRRQPQPRGP
jgi:hypothetical protein